MKILILNVPIAQNKTKFKVKYISETAQIMNIFILETFITKKTEMLDLCWQQSELAYQKVEVISSELVISQYSLKKSFTHLLVTLDVKKYTSVLFAIGLWEKFLACIVTLIDCHAQGND